MNKWQSSNFKLISIKFQQKINTSSKKKKKTKNIYIKFQMSKSSVINISQLCHYFATRWIVSCGNKIVGPCRFMISLLTSRYMAKLWKCLWHWTYSFQINKSVIYYNKKITPNSKLQNFCKCFNIIKIMKNVKPFKTHYNRVGQF